MESRQSAGNGNHPLDLGFQPLHKAPTQRARVIPGLLGVWLKATVFCRMAAILGECPEWQRGRTVNPLRYRFEGSSPSSPTIA